MRSVVRFQLPLLGIAVAIVAFVSILYILEVGPWRYLVFVVVVLAVVCGIASRVLWRQGVTAPMYLLLGLLTAALANVVLAIKAEDLGTVQRAFFGGVGTALTIAAGSVVIESYVRSRRRP